MGIRDEEIKRLEKYSEGLGMKVTYRKKTPNSPWAEWVIDGSEIFIYDHPKISKTQMILSFLHELGHAHDHLANNRERNRDLEIALKAEDNRTNEAIDKNMRFLIYEDEKQGAEHRLKIAHEVGIKVPEWKIKLDIELDIWSYYQYYLKGDHPSVTEYNLKYKELKRKYEKRK